jgi:hypothetical protein
MKSRSIVLFLVGLFLLLASFSNAEMRKWTRKNGKEFEAEFVKREGPVVTLKRPDGTEMTVKMPQLSDEDRKYVKQLTKESTDQPKSEQKPNAEMRKWTRKNGKEFEAEFVKRDGPVVTLKKPDGTEFTVKMPHLSDEDRKYVNQLTKGKGKAAAKEGDQKSAESPAAKPSTGEGLFAKVAAQREHEKQTVESLRAALEGFPLNCLKAEVVGEPKEVGHDAHKTNIAVKICIQADTETFHAFRKRLLAVLDKVAIDKWNDDPYMVFRKDRDGERAYYRFDFDRDLHFDNMDRVFGIPHTQDEVKRAVQRYENYCHWENKVLGTGSDNTKHIIVGMQANNGDWSRIAWRYYAIDRIAETVLDEAMKRACECRLSSVGTDGKALLLHKAPFLVSKKNPCQDPDSPHSCADDLSSQTLLTGLISRYYISETFFGKWQDGFGKMVLAGDVIHCPVQSRTVHITMTDSELKDVRKMTCELRLMESKNRQ